MTADQCRVAFEKWFEDTSGFTENDEGIAMAAFKAAWTASRADMAEEMGRLREAVRDLSDFAPVLTRNIHAAVIRECMEGGK
ncbi:hypothetical protein [Roseicella sp. DB1501]|uniref:hypothetical protein n=1 Tax=Roseicella sp. DB1501 TaxID=2730925 RepID=UPI0014928216|nr:hypothetical protein [Roseicella sp. DB1501]NOG70493.1 hypothetical protein [Roseicella sp. DB1501]